MIETHKENGITQDYEEFFAYRILFNLTLGEFYSIVKKKNCFNKMSEIVVLTEQAEELKNFSCVIHASNVIDAVTTSNYHNFFSLYKNAPNMGGFVLAPLLIKMREMSLEAMKKAYK
jgi:hypothetical protein